MISQNAMRSELEVAADTQDAKRYAEKAGGAFYAGYIMVDVDVIYDLPDWVTGVKLGAPTRPNKEGHYKVPVVLANGDGTKQDYVTNGISIIPENAAQIKVIVYPGTKHGHRLLYLASNTATK